MDKPSRQTWQDEVDKIYIFHKTSIETNPSHSVRATARELDFSVGKISEALRLAHWMRVYPKLGLFVNKSDALDFMKHKVTKDQIDDRRKSS